MTLASGLHIHAHLQREPTEIAGGCGNLPIIPASEGGDSWLARLAIISEFWVCGDSASTNKLKEQWRMIPDINLGLHVLRHTYAHIHAHKRKNK